jgi:hypothetical protein
MVNLPFIFPQCSGGPWTSAVQGPKFLKYLQVTFEKPLVNKIGKKDGPNKSPGGGFCNFLSRGLDYRMTHIRMGKRGLGCRKTGFLWGLVLCLGLLVVGSGAAATLDTIGVTLLNTVATNLNGTGVRVAQVEADDPNSGEYEVNPTVPAQPVTKFTYYGTSGSSSSFPNSVGACGRGG